MRLFRLVAVLSLALILAGCATTQLAYNNVDILLRWQANRYFGLDAVQGDDFDARLAVVLGWHRARALPQYQRVTEELAARLGRSLRGDDLAWAHETLRAQIREALRAASLEMAPLLDSLSPEQIARLERRLEEENRKFAREQLAGASEERRRRRARQHVERLEQWFGSLTEAQVERVRQWSERAPLTAELRDRERRRLQSEFVAMLRAREARKRLADWAPYWDRHREPEFAAQARAHLAETFALYLDLDRMLTPAQRDTAVARLRGWAGDFAALAQQARPATAAR